MKHLLILCNAIDETVRVARGITTDSPAASRKVFMAAAAIRRAGVRTTIVSLGRGRRSGGPEVHRAAIRRSPGGPALYLRFANRPLWSELGSLFAAARAVFWLHRRGRDETLLLYNRAPAYVLAMLTARVLGMRIVLDLEDGFEGARTGWRGRWRRVRDRLFDMAASRALLACTALAADTRLRPVLPYYGVAVAAGGGRRSGQVVALMGGTVSAVQGGEWLIAAITAMRDNGEAWTRSLAFEVTGKGDAIAGLAALAGDGPPAVTVWGRTSDADYEAIRRRVDVGLSLKPNDGPLAHTTFPSKVVEMAAAGMVVVTTDISDVRQVLGDDGAVYLTDNSVAALVAALRWVVANRDAAAATATRGTAAVARACDPLEAGPRLAAFLFPPAA